MEAIHIGRNRHDVVFDVVIFILLTIIFLIVAYPLYFIIISSISDPVAVAQGKVVAVPIGFTLDGYKSVFEHGDVMRGFKNSLIYTVVGVTINLLVTLPTSYALSRKDFLLRKPITLFYMVTMFVGGGMIPTYLIVRGTGLINTMWALVIPGCLGVYNMIVARTFFTTNIPVELMEAAKLDGCGNTRFFVSIVLPLSGAIIAILFLYYGVGHWNSYFSALLYINDREKMPLQMELRMILIQNSDSMTKTTYTEAERLEKERLEALKEMMKYSLIIISSIPVLIIYPFVQKFFVKGVMIGSVKG
ncbi:MAG: carbohydrate ABC transporter permease [Clostridia bacterium]|nr:carbohydrate ABC transporter permease [Clostridia bacterium]MBQ9409972.1 carbohydrate ABC transporter permease [Clostridia bacterium]